MLKPSGHVEVVSILKTGGAILSAARTGFDDQRQVAPTIRVVGTVSPGPGR